MYNQSHVSEYRTAIQNPPTTAALVFLTESVQLVMGSASPSSALTIPINGGMSTSGLKLTLAPVWDGLVMICVSIKYPGLNDPRLPVCASMVTLIATILASGVLAAYGGSRADIYIVL